MHVNCNDFILYIYCFVLLTVIYIFHITVNSTKLQNTVFYILNSETKLYNINRDFKRKVAH